MILFENERKESSHFVANVVYPHLSKGESVTSGGLHDFFRVIIGGYSVKCRKINNRSQRMILID